MRILLRSLIALSLIGFLVAEVSAQGPGRGDRGRDRGGRGGWGGRGGGPGGPGGPGGGWGGGRGGWGGGRGGWGGGGRGGFDPKGMLDRFDANKDGKLSSDELQGGRGGFARGMVERAGFDLKKPVKISKLVESFNKRMGGGSRGDDRNKEKESDKTVAGFGEEPLFEAASSFDIPLGFEQATEQELVEKYNQQIVDYANKNILAGNDKNGNNILDASEWGAVRWRGDPKDSDLNGDGRLTREELVIRVAKRWGVQAREKKSSSRRSSRSRDSSTSSKDSSPSKDREKIRRFARSFIKQKDTNGNGRLEGDELKKVSDYEKYDANKDKVISEQEMIAYNSAFAKSKGSSSRDRGRRSYGGRSERRDRGSSSRSPSVATYRFLSPVERLPKGLPSWFTARDTNQDGQVAMSEYSSSWSDSKASEFQKYDLNQDGLITPEESLAGK